MDENADGRFFESLSAGTESDDSLSSAASPRLRSKIYSALVNRMEESGPLLDMAATGVTDGLCVFEKLVEIAPLGEKVAAFNACGVCHARVLAERLPKAPIYWSNCPYVGFQGR
jgi:hypothetical protein